MTDRGGEEEPVDLELRRSRDGFQPEAPLVGLRIGERAGDGIELPDQDVAVVPEVDRDRTATVTRDRAYFNALLQQSRINFPNGGKEMRNRDNTFERCGGQQRIWIRRMSAVGRNDGAWQNIANDERANLTTSGACLRQYHLRLWDSDRHAQLENNPIHEHEYVIGSIHHELTPKTTKKCSELEN